MISKITWTSELMLRSKKPVSEKMLMERCTGVDVWAEERRGELFGRPWERCLGA